MTLRVLSIYLKARRHQSAMHSGCCALHSGHRALHSGLRAVHSDKISICKDFLYNLILTAIIFMLSQNETKLFNIFLHAAKVSR